MAFFESLFNLVAEFVLLPILAALLIYIGTELYSKKSGRELSDEFHKFSFILALGVVVTWVLSVIIPKTWFLPFNFIKISSAFGFAAYIFTLHYLVYWLQEVVFHNHKNTLTLGIFSGLVRSKMAINVMESAYKNGSVERDSVTFSVLLSSSIMIFRNLILAWFFGVVSGLFGFPPNYFFASMLVMAIFSGILALVFYKKTDSIEEVEFTTLPLQGVGQFIIFFLFFYMVSATIVKILPGFVYYLFSALAGVVYGYVQFFISAGFMGTGSLPISIALIAIFISSLFSLLSDIGHVALEGDKEMLFALAVPVVVPAIAGIITLVFLFL